MQFVDMVPIFYGEMAMFSVSIAQVINRWIRFKGMSTPLGLVHA